MNNRIITPWNNPPAAPAALQAAMDQVTEASRDVYIRHVNETVDDSLKAVSGGILPTAKAKRKHLKGLRHPEGLMFYWKSKPLLFVSNPMFRDENGKLQMDVVDKRMYVEDTPLPPQLAENN